MKSRTSVVSCSWFNLISMFSRPFKLRSSCKSGSSSRVLSSVESSDKPCAFLTEANWSCKSSMCFCKSSTLATPFCTSATSESSESANARTSTILFAFCFFKASSSVSISEIFIISSLFI